MQNGLFITVSKSTATYSVLLVGFLTFFKLSVPLDAVCDTKRLQISPKTSGGFFRGKFSSLTNLSKTSASPFD